MEKTFFVCFFGRVQGVSLRMNILLQAQKLGVTGWVMNSTSVNVVEATFQGEEKQVNKLIDFVKSNPGGARVEQVVVNELKESERFESFELKY